MRRLVKVLHTLASCGLIGGLACYMILLALAPQDSPIAYADLRHAIAAISDYVLVPSLALALITGLLSMVIHKPYLSKRWAWVKAAMGILMFKGVLTVVGSMADKAAVLSHRIAEGEPARKTLDEALVHEWEALGVIMFLSIANVVLGVWRPRLERRPESRRQAGRAQGASEPSDTSEVPGWLTKTASNRGHSR